MKKVFFVLMAICFVSTLAFAEDVTKAVPTTTAAVVVTSAPVAPAAPVELALKGDILDNMCAGVNKDVLLEFVKTHTKKCAIACMDSGYSLFANGSLYKFNKASNAKVEGFLKKADSKLQVSVTAKQVGDELELVSIENQK